MKIQDQVATVEQCQKLEALGVECARPAYHWIYDSGMRWKLHPLDYYNLHEEGIEYHPAFTVAELGVMLPDGGDVRGSANLSQFRSFRVAKSAVGRHGIEAGFVCSADYHECRGNANGFDAYECWKHLSEPTEAQALAAMLIYLLENKHITADEVNQRLQS